MNIKKIAKDTAKTLSSYLTYEAVKIVLAQLTETNPPLAQWFQRFSGTDKIQDGEFYIEQLFRENPDLALRIMSVRVHIAEEVSEYLPEMVKSNILQANTQHRRQHFERLTQLEASEPSPPLEQQTEKEANSDFNE
uniref:RuBisCO chaperone RbcX n=1 Tax=Scytonematopsis sp. 2 PNG7-MK64 TaxID=1931088 RepID=A0A2D0WWZ1_9CYAN|nr:chaperonin-like protein [Scytonematopsis sp. 2 PNG7-MK64]